MSVESLMVQAVTLRVPAGETQDAIGGPTESYTESATVMYLEPVRSREVLENRNTPIGDWIGYGKATDPFDSQVQVVYDGRTLEVIGPPRLMFNPRVGAASHYEMVLQEVT